MTEQMALYRTLGIPPDAAPDDVKAAYLRKAKETHPDAGGSKDEFQQVSVAYKVLSDSERRKKYDSTGEYDAGAVDLREAEALTVIAAFVEHVVSMKDVDFTQDIALAFRKSVSLNVERFEEAIRDLTFMAKTAEKLAARMKHKAGSKPNAFSEIALVKRRKIELQIQQNVRQIEIMRRALEIMADFEFEVDAVTLHGSGMSAAGATSNTTWFFMERVK